MRVSLIGKTSWNKEWEKEIKEIGKVLAEKDEIVLLPAEGICFETAREYKKNKGEKVLGLVPYQDKDFGIEHLKEYIDSGIFNELIDCGTWYKRDYMHCLFGNCVLCLGYSLGTISELANGYYLYKILSERNIEKEKIHSNLKAEKNFDLIIYKPFVSGKLLPEIEKKILELNCKIYYVQNSSELQDVLKNLREKF